MWRRHPQLQAASTWTQPHLPLGSAAARQPQHPLPPAVHDPAAACSAAASCWRAGLQRKADRYYLTQGTSRHRKAVHQARQDACSGSSAGGLHLAAIAHCPLRARAPVPCSCGPATVTMHTGQHMPPPPPAAHQSAPERPVPSEAGRLSPCCAARRTPQPAGGSRQAALWRLLAAGRLAANKFR